MAGTIVSIVAGGLAWAASYLPSRLQMPLAGSAGPFANTLAPHLSVNASICHPGSICYAEATQRWNPWRQPHFDVIVRVATSQDVAECVKAANAHRKPFLAISGGHGAAQSLAKMQAGVGIWLVRLNDVEVRHDSSGAEGYSVARVGGGITSGELLHKLWPKGKQAVVGNCECTGAATPMLGCGHGYLQGHYGRMCDNMLSVDLVLANGSSITVSEQRDHDGLFWALRGAGHNFGIVSSFEYKVYDHTPDNEEWSIETLLFASDKLENVFKVANGMHGDSQRNMPVELMHFGYIGPVPGFEQHRVSSSSHSPDTQLLTSLQSLITFILMYQGSTIPEQYSKPLRDLEPIHSTVASTDLRHVAETIGGFDFRGQFCSKTGPIIQRMPVSLEHYNVSALRTATDMLAELPNGLEHSSMIFEAWSQNAVKSVSSESTAYPDRHNNLLLSPFIIYNRGSPLDEVATEHGRRLQQVLQAGSGKPLNAYVNYANGYESQQAIYGYESWRLQKLRRLKREWDPHGRFSYYLPIEV